MSRWPSEDESETHRVEETTMRHAQRSVWIAILVGTAACDGAGPQTGGGGSGGAGTSGGAVSGGATAGSSGNGGIAGGRAGSGGLAGSSSGCLLYTSPSPRD